MPLPRHAFFRGRIVPYCRRARRSPDARSQLRHRRASPASAATGTPAEQELFVFRPQDHFRRFLESARLLDMTLPYSVADLTEALVALLRTELFREDCYARPLAFYADESIGVRLHNLTPEVSIVAMPYGRYVENEEGVHATISSWRRVDDNMIPPRGQDHGLLRQLGFRQDRRAARRLRRGHRAEPGRPRRRRLGRELLPVKNGAAITPPVTDNVLEGITRRIDPRAPARRSSASPSSSARSTAPRSRSPTRPSSAAPACRSPPSRASTTGRSARAAWAPSSPRCAISTSTSCAENAPSTGPGATPFTRTRTPASGARREPPARRPRGRPGT